MYTRTHTDTRSPLFFPDLPIRYDDDVYITFLCVKYQEAIFLYSSPITRDKYSTN